MRDLEELLAFAKEHAEDESLVLCTLVRKHGSSYRAEGAKKLVAARSPSNGATDVATSIASCGTLSGGCMEGAIERAALARLEQLPFVESFSTMSDEDRLMGYQTGCQGRIEVLFESIHAHSPEELAVFLAYGAEKPACAIRVSLEPSTLAERTLTDSLLPEAGAYLDRWIEPLVVTVIGCGADSFAYVDLGHALGWSLRFVDYRSDFTARFQEQCPGARVDCLEAASIAASVATGRRSAVILATHNYEADLQILAGLSTRDFGYVGCLGPQARWQRLKRDLADFHELDIAPEWEPKVFAPAGIFSRGRSPTEIALSIAAQVQGVLNEPQPEHEWTILLAAGEARRFGSAKALAPWGSTTLLGEALAKARKVTGERTIVVTGAHADTIEAELRASTPKVLIARNENWEKGLGSSISAGIEAILAHDPSARLALILPVDQPLITAEHLRRLANECDQTTRCALTSDERRAGPPAALPRRLFESARKLRGDSGLKTALRPSDIVCVEAPDELRDADRPEELRALAKDLA